MKKVIFLSLILIFFILFLIIPAYTQNTDPKTTFLIYFNNIFGEFTPAEVNYAASNLHIILKSKYNIQLIDNGLSSKAISLEVLKKFNLNTYAELSGRVTSIYYSTNKYKVGISLNLVFDSLKTGEIDLEKTKTYEGEESSSIVDSRTFTLSNAYIDIFSENIEKIKEILAK